MEIITSSISGFCFGVRRAVKLAEKASEKGVVYSLGPLIHNRTVISELSKKGIRIISSLRGMARNEVLLIRSHGVHPRVLREARKKGVRIIDATCPFVARCQRLAKSLVTDGYRVIIFGDKNHNEVKSIVGFTGDNAEVVECPEDLKKAVRGASKVGLLSQTTQSKDAFRKIVSELVELVPEIKIFNTICQAAGRRQEEAERLSKKADLAIVVGGRHSANTAQLASIFRKSGIETYHVENLKELARYRINGHKTIAVMAGASTPESITRNIIDYLAGKTPAIR